MSSRHFVGWNARFGILWQRSLCQSVLRIDWPGGELVIVFVSGSILGLITRTLVSGLPRWPLPSSGHVTCFLTPSEPPNDMARRDLIGEVFDWTVLETSDWTVLNELDLFLWLPSSTIVSSDILVNKSSWCLIGLDWSLWLPSSLTASSSGVLINLFAWSLLGLDWLLWLRSSLIPSCDVWIHLFAWCLCVERWGDSWGNMWGQLVTCVEQMSMWLLSSWSVSIFCGVTWEMVG